MVEDLDLVPSIGVAAMITYNSTCQAYIALFRPLQSLAHKLSRYINIHIHLKIINQVGLGIAHL